MQKIREDQSESMKVNFALDYVFSNNILQPTTSLDVTPHGAELNYNLNL